jgi:hypothetical protein
MFDSQQIRIEYHGWQRYQSLIYPFVASNPTSETMNIWLGGEDYLDYALYSRPSRTLPFTYNHRRLKRFDATGRLVSDTFVDSTDQWDKEDWSYYPNGDVASEIRTSSRSQKPIQEMRYENVYLGNNLIRVSTLTSAGRPFRRFSFEYGDPSSVFGEKSEGYQLASYGRVVYLPPGQHVLVITSMLGQCVTKSVSVEGEYTLDFPSGLYFISIDGGKPRKHLIP